MDHALRAKPAARSRALPLACLATALATTLIPNKAQAVLNIYIFDTGGSFAIESRGTLQLGNQTGTAGCSPPSTTLAFIIPSASSITLCTNNGNNDTPSYDMSLVSGQEPWGPVSEIDGTYTGSGYSLQAGYQGGGDYFATYVASGDPISSTATFNVPITTLGLNVTSGLIAQYKIDSTNDTINVYADSPPPDPVPADVPAPLPLFGAAAAFGWSRSLRRRISRQHQI